MKVYIDGVRILVTALITYEGMNSLYRKGGGELQYIEGSRTYDTLRYGHKDGNLPFITRFRDRYNHEWNVEIENYWDSVNVFIPCGTQMLWYGADESPTRTGSDAQTQWAQVEFSYQGGSGGWFGKPAGIRITFTGYKDRSTGEWKVDLRRWNNILDIAKKGTEVTGAVIDQVEQGVEIYRSG